VDSQSILHIFTIEAYTWFNTSQWGGFTKYTAYIYYRGLHVLTQVNGVDSQSILHIFTIEAYTCFNTSQWGGFTKYTAYIYYRGLYMV
jgi:hypothetical protein